MGGGETLKMRLQCSLDLHVDFQSYCSVKERDVEQLDDNDNTGNVYTLQEKDDLKSYQRIHLGSTIVIIPGHLKSHLQAKKSGKKNCKKKTRFLDYEEEEFSSEGMVEKAGIEEEFRSDHQSNALMYLPTLRRTLS